MDNKMFRAFALAFRILFCLGIISNIHVNGQGDAQVKIHDDCRLHELCPLDCVRCDTVPQCYDMSDEFGCGHGMDVFHKLFPGPPVPPGTTLEKLKETLWVEKVAYIREQLQKSLNNNVTVKTGQMLFKPEINTRHPSSAVKTTIQPRSYTEYKDSYRSLTTTPSYARFDSGINKSAPSRTDSSIANQNMPSLYSPKADASPLINWLGASEEKLTSPEKGQSNQELVNSGRIAGLAVPIQPVPFPDPEPPAKHDMSVEHAFVDAAPTAPDIMPPIELPTTTTNQPMSVQYQEPTAVNATDNAIDTEKAAAIDTSSVKERIVIFQPEALPETGATVALPKVTRKPDTVVAAIDSVISSLFEPQSDPLSGNSDIGQIPTLSLSEVPMSKGVIPNLSQNTVTDSQAGLDMSGNTSASADVKAAYQEAMDIFQDKSLPSIPMLPGLIPQIEPAPAVRVNNSEPVVDYKVGDLFMAVPPETKQPDSSTVAEQQGVLSKDIKSNRNEINEPIQGIPVTIIDQSLVSSQSNQANDSVNIWSANQQKPMTNQEVQNTQNVAFQQTMVDRQEKARVSFGNDQTYVDTSPRTNAYDQTGSIDLLSLLFPGLKESAIKRQSQDARPFIQETKVIVDQANVVVGNTPETMPDIVPATRVPMASTSVEIPTSKKDNGNGCDRVQDYTGFCSTRTHGYFKNNFDCNSYIVCDWGKMHVCRCPQATMFDPDLGVCNWETEVDCY